MIPYRHCGDHAVVLFREELTWEATVDLVDTVDLLVDMYFYDRIELVLVSNGGLAAAFDHYWAARRRWRARDVRIVTRAVSHAHSAAALMLSLGDERIAGPSAQLLYHPVRIVAQGAVTASGSAQIHADLSRLEAEHVRWLVERALYGAPARPPLVAEAEPWDEAVLASLVSRLLPADARAPRSLRGLVQCLARHVRRAVRGRDHAALGALYRALFALDSQISAKLALTLRLVDRVGGAVSDAARASRAPWLAVPEWRSLFPDHGEVDRALLVRHLLALGETGSGKSASVILPAVRALAGAPPERISASIVIDPKHEIGPLLERLVPERLERLNPRDAGLTLMGGPHWSIDAALANGRWLAAATTILIRAVSFVPTSPARVLVGHEMTGANAEFFDREGTEFLLTVLAFVLMMMDSRAPAPEEWLEDDAAALAWVRDLLERARGAREARGPNLFALSAIALQGALVEPPSDDSASWPVLDDAGATYEPRSRLVLPFEEAPAPPRREPPPPPKGWLFGRIARHASRVWRTGEARDLLDRVLHYWEPMVVIERQYAGVLATARAACSDMAEPHVATTLYAGCEPGARGAGFDFAGAVSPDAGGRVLLLQPARDGQDTVVTKVLKALVFEALFADPVRRHGAPDLPLLGYVCDEFHHFATSDPVHGEATFLDACRSHGVCCVLACQSVSSLEHAFAHGGASEVGNHAAVSILWNNTSTKFIFRTGDPRTVARLEDLCPYRPGFAPVTQVRPLSTLAPGECYASLADGRFERRQLAPVVSLAPERTTRRARSRPARPARGRRRSAP